MVLWWARLCCHHQNSHVEPAQRRYHHVAVAVRIPPGADVWGTDDDDVAAAGAADGLSFVWVRACVLSPLELSCRARQRLHPTLLLSPYAFQQISKDLPQVEIFQTWKLVLNIFDVCGDLRI